MKKGSMIFIDRSVESGPVLFACQELFCKLIE